MNTRALIFPAMLLLAICGCHSAIKHAKTTALSGADLVSITDDMANKIAVSDAVNAAIAREGALTVVVQPVVNHLRAEVIPSGEALAFTGRVRALLSEKSHEKFVWVMNKQAFYDLQARQLDNIPPGPDPQRLQPRYALTATFSGLSEESRKSRNVYYLCQFELTNLQDGQVLWTDKYELSKKVVKGFLD